MKYRFFTCDVFTSQRFRGNQLAVLPEADGLTEDQMQQIAREFNFSANCALAGFLAHLDENSEGSYAWRIAQGVEMGRPCILEARSEKRDGVVTGTWIGGVSSMVSEGFIRV